MPGETIFIQAKAKPKCKIVINDKIILQEQPKTNHKNIAGYYTTTYKLKANDNLQKIKAVLFYNNNEVHTKLYNNSIELLSTDEPIVGYTQKDFTPVYIGLGTDRLGGAKLGYLDSMVNFRIIGAVGNMYKVQFAPQHIFFIPKESVKLKNDGVALPTSLTNSMSVSGDSMFDYVRVALNTKIPYSSTMQAKQNTIELLLYGATSNTNWLTQYPETLEAIEDVDITQLQNEVVKITVYLKQHTQWGYSTYYEGNTFVLRVRRQKKDLSIKNLLIGIDAGHGGSNFGAKGIAGSYEKEFTLLIANEVTKLLQKKGASVITTRQNDIDFENTARLKYFTNKLPDIAISIHLNSAADPIKVKGTSTYYKHHAMKGLSLAIYKRMTETGLKPWGNIGNFNFYLNSVTEFPTALVETLFISHPEDEEKIHDPSFRTQIAEKIIQGIEDWIQQVPKAN
jgi:N-acetylmuramoyl-L-alanine amidase